MDERLSLYFTAPYQVETRSEPLADPGEGQVRVEAILSAISSGTEGLVYRGQFPPELSLDESLPDLQGGFQYPLQYGYCWVGQVTECGPGVSADWQGRKVFAFHPHESAFIASPDSLLPLPEGISPEQAVFLPNMETAVSLLLDGAPRIGERALVIGQGIVGLLTTALLARFPLASLVTLERFPLRREASQRLGVTQSLDPQGLSEVTLRQAVLTTGEQPSYWEGADLTYELSGAPQAVNSAIAATGFDGRIVIGSWYGTKRAPIDLGGRFHRSRIRLISSQVSSLNPELSGRWTKARRLNLAWEMLRQVQPEKWITHRYALTQARQAYEVLEQQAEKAIQVVLHYST